MQATNSFHFELLPAPAEVHEVVDTVEQQ